MAIYKQKEITEIINERKFIDMLLEEQYADYENIFKILNALARHCYWDLGYRKTRTTKFLKNYLLKNLANFREANLYEQAGYRNNRYYIWDRRFNKAYNFASTRPICEADGVWITQAELTRIAELNNRKIEKLAFTCLCYAKIILVRKPKAFPWIYPSKDREIRMQSRMRTVSEYNTSIGKLYESGLVRLYEPPEPERFSLMHPKTQDRIRAFQGSYTVTFIDDNSPGVIFVDDWRELGYYYLRYKGENIIKCARCGKLTRGNKNGTKKYCRDCASPEKAHKDRYNFFRCEDCGKVTYIEASIKTQKRCDRCKELERKRHNHEMYEKRKAQKESENSTNLSEDEAEK